MIIPPKIEYFGGLKGLNMKRMEKYPDTATFYFYNANPHNKFVGDCVIRAICTALEQSWEQTVRELTEIGIKYGYLVDEPKCYGRYLESKGWVKCKQPRKKDNTKYTGREFCEKLQEWSSDIPTSVDGRYIAHIGGHHMVAIVNGRVFDTWNSTGGCIGNYWVKTQ